MPEKSLHKQHSEILRCDLTNEELGPTIAAAATMKPRKVKKEAGGAGAAGTGEAVRSFRFARNGTLATILIEDKDGSSVGLGALKIEGIPPSEFKTLPKDTVEQAIVEICGGVERHCRKSAIASDKQHKSAYAQVLSWALDVAAEARSKP